jgi:sporulation protein YlmC with PRC-barrel domain
MGQDPNKTGARSGRVGRSVPVPAWRDHLAVRDALAQGLVSLANLVGRPVVDSAGDRVGTVRDVVVRWESGTAHPPVVGVLIKVGKGAAIVATHEVTLTQSSVRLLSPRTGAVLPERGPGDVALARDVLDHQLVDVTGVQVVRAADVYLARRGSGWELAGVDIGLWALLRRVFPKRRTCPSPDRALDWADLQAFVPRFADQSPAGPADPAAAAGQRGSSVQTAYPTAQLHRLRAKDVAELLAGLDRDSQAQLATMGDSATVADALSQLEPAKVDALLSGLDEADRVKLGSLLGRRTR